MTTSSSPRGKDALAIAGSLALPGLGHLLSRCWVRGLVWCAGNILLTGALLLVFAVPRFLPALIVLAPLALIAQLALVVDSCISARRTPRPLLPTPATRYVTALAMLILTFLLSPGTLLANYIRSHYAHTYRVASGSMAPTLRDGERFVCRPLGRGTIRRWDIVVFSPANWSKGAMVKRIAGLPGETLEIKGGQVWIDGKPVPLPSGVPPIADTSASRVFPSRGGEDHPVKLGPGEFFVIGDNSEKSLDSRNIVWGLPGSTPGAITTKQIEGIVSAVYWPPSRWRRFE
ncbi:MAG: signal peptidase I [Tepidisphaerales bacterium]